MKLALLFSLAGLSLVEAGVKIDCMKHPECPCVGYSCGYWVDPGPDGKNCVSAGIQMDHPDKTLTLGEAIGKTLEEAIEACLSEECGGQSACEWGKCPWDAPDFDDGMDPALQGPFPGFPCLPEITSSFGDPHFKTWSGDYFDFHGECDLALVHTSNFGGLDIHARTTIRYGYSFIEAAALRIGDDILEVSSYGDYSINGIDGASSGNLRGQEINTLGDYPIYQTVVDSKTTKFEIVLNEHSNITIGNMKDLVSVKVIHGSEFGHVSGLWGNIAGEKKMRDGSTISTDMNAFGQEWQVREDEPMLFRDARAPQHPQQCIMPNMEEREARRLGEGVTEGAAEAACAHLKNHEHDFANCVYDVMATNDLEMASGGAI